MALEAIHLQGKLLRTMSVQRLFRHLILSRTTLILYPDGMVRTECLHFSDAFLEWMVGFLTIWLFSAVAHWMKMDTMHGNECVPILIGEQGCGKSTFCNRLLPPELREYFFDHINFGNKLDFEMALTNGLMVNLDEFH